MSSQKYHKRWRDKVFEELLADDDITISDDPNDVRLHRKRIFEREVYKISKIEMKRENSTDKEKSANKISDVSLIRRKLISEIDKGLEDLKSQKKFLQMGRRSNQDKTWSEKLAANISSGRNREMKEKSILRIEKLRLAVLRKLKKIEDKQVTDACTQSSFRKPKVKLANSSTQVGSSIQGSKRRVLRNKSSNGRNNLTTSDLKMKSPTTQKQTHDLAKRFKSKPYGRSSFNSHQSPDGLKTQRYQHFLTENHVQLEKESQKDETKIIYKRRTEKKVVKKRHAFLKPQQREELTKNFLKISVEHSTSGSILDSGKIEQQRKSKTQVKFLKEIQNDSSWKVLSPCKKSFSYSKVNLHSESKAFNSDQVNRLGSSLGKKSQISSTLATKKVESHHINSAEAFISTSSQNGVKRIHTAGHQSHNLSGSLSEIDDQSLVNSTSRTSINILPNLIDDSTYTRPNNDKNKEYIILPYCSKPKEKDLTIGTSYKRSLDVYGLTSEALGKCKQYIQAVENSVVNLENVERLNKLNKIEDGTIRDTLPLKSLQSKSSDQKLESTSPRFRKSSHSAIGQTDNRSFKNKSRISELDNQYKSKVPTTLDRSNHIKSQQTSLRSKSKNQSEIPISARERTISDIALDQSHHKSADLPNKTETNHERSLKHSKSPSKGDINNLKLDETDDHSFKDTSLTSKCTTYHQLMDRSRRSESSLEEVAIRLYELRNDNLKEIQSSSDRIRRKIENSPSKPETNYSLSNTSRLNDRKSKKKSYNSGLSEAHQTSDDHKTEEIFSKSETEQENRTRASPLSDKQRRLDSSCRSDASNEQGIKHLKPVQGDNNSIKSKSNRSEIQDISPKSEASHKHEGHVLPQPPNGTTFSSVLSPETTNESRRSQLDTKWQAYVKSHENKPTKKDSTDFIKSETQDILLKSDIDNKLETTYPANDTEFKLELEISESSRSLRRRQTYPIINEIDNKILQDTFREPGKGLKQEHPSSIRPEALISSKQNQLATKSTLDPDENSPAQRQFTGINDSLSDSLAQPEIRKTKHNQNMKPRYRDISHLSQEPNNTGSTSKSFTLDIKTAASEAIESPCDFKSDQLNESELKTIESSKLAENEFNVKYDNPETDVEYLDPQIEEAINFFQKQLKNCNEFVKKQLMQNLAAAKESFKDTKTCKLDIKPTLDNLEPHKVEAKPVIDIKSEQSESDEMELLSAKAQSSGDETCFCCPCCTCSARGTSSRSSSQKDSSTHSEIPPFTGCDCMKEDYYKIMRIAYN